MAPVREVLAVDIFAQSGGLPPRFGVNKKPVSSAVGRSLQMSGLLLCFWSRRMIHFWVAMSANGVGVELLKQEGFMTLTGSERWD